MQPDGVVFDDSLHHPRRQYRRVKVVVSRTHRGPLPFTSAEHESTVRTAEKWLPWPDERRGRHRLRRRPCRGIDLSSLASLPSAALDRRGHRAALAPSGRSDRRGEVRNALHDAGSTVDFEAYLLGPGMALLEALNGEITIGPRNADHPEGWEVTMLIPLVMQSRRSRRVRMAWRFGSTASSPKTRPAGSRCGLFRLSRRVSRPGDPQRQPLLPLRPSALEDRSPPRSEGGPRPAEGGVGSASDDRPTPGPRLRDTGELRAAPDNGRRPASDRRAGSGEGGDDRPRSSASWNRSEAGSRRSSGSWADRARPGILRD